MDIIPRLSLNKKPKDIENNSLVDAINIKLSNDNHTITGEENIIEHNTIMKELRNSQSTYGNNFKIIYCIACNTELVLFVQFNNSNKLVLFRYNEEFDKIIKVYDNWEYNGGKLIGTFTYNVDNSLIILVSEYKEDNSINIPLRTINLGKLNVSSTNISIDTNIPNDLNLDINKLSTVPEVSLPNISYINHVAGKCYKGWYHIFIRYKINKNDYTQWYNIGFPIYMDSINRYSIIDYKYGQQFANIEIPPAYLKFMNSVIPKSYVSGCSDNFSDTKDICENTFEIDLKYPDNNVIEYDFYQLGFACISKTYSKAFRTNDIKKDNLKFIFTNELVVEESLVNLTTKYYNYNNVKNLFNYKNRVYIGNYKENNYNKKDFTFNNSPYNFNNIKLNFKLDSTSYDIIEKITPIYPFNLYDNGGQIHDIKKHTESQVYGGEYKDSITFENDYYIPRAINLSTFFNIDANTNITIGNIGEAGEPVRVGSCTIIPIDTSAPSKIKIKTTSKEYTSKVFISINNSITYMDLESNYCFTSNTYINGKINFRDRCIFTSLIPGEVYNFFIHFIDKYGHATNGIKLNNKRQLGYSITNNTLEYNTGNWGYIKIPLLKELIVSGIDTCYILVDVTQKVKTNNKFNILETSDTPVYGNNKFYIFSDKINKPINGIDTTIVYKPYTLQEQQKQILYNYINCYITKHFNIFSDLYWYQLIYSEQNFDDQNKGIYYFDYYKNINGDELFKVPQVKDFKIDPITSSGIVTPSCTLITLNISGVEIPDGYVGYYISYEKLEPIKFETGLLTKSDFRSQSIINKDEDKKVIDTINNSVNSSKMYFYTSEYDIADSIKLDYKFMMIEGKNIFKEEDIQSYDWMQLAFGIKYPIDYNKFQKDESGGCGTVYPINNYKLCVGGSASDNRINLGTALEMDNIAELFPSTIINDINDIEINNLYKVSLYNPSLNIYTNKNKQLIRCSDIYYDNSQQEVTKNLNGRYTFNNFLVYADTGLIFNDAEKIAIAEKDITGVDYKTYSENFVQFQKTYYPAVLHHTYEMNRPFAAYIQMPVIKNAMLDSKCFNNEPTKIAFPTTINSDTESKEGDIYYGSIVTPANSIDLFKNNQTTFDDSIISINVNYNEELINTEVFTKTIRRSNVIQDESRENAWRKFATEAYKNITENKGEITNIIGLGTNLLVHTTDSLFVFDTNNILKTNEQDVQLQQPDAFEVAYKELFTSILGFGGLQDRESWISGSFGYIYYNRDTNRIFKYDNNQIDYIDKDITNWIIKVKPTKINFVIDDINNRILLNIYYNNTNTVLSYNYVTNTFISKHSYTFNKGYNTKNKLYYILYNNTNDIDIIYTSDRTFSAFNHFANTKENNGVLTAQYSTFSICCNYKYETIKNLEFINYVNKLIDCNSNNDLSTEIAVNRGVIPDSLPVEGISTKYSGYRLRIYNTQCDTGILDINVDFASEEYNKVEHYKLPYYDKGIWNFNYIRDIKNAGSIKIDSTMSMIYGNYFIFQFVMNYFDDKTFEFETLNYKLTE